jgi:serine/threonine protein kinase
MPLKDYALDHRPLGTGGQAEVFPAKHRLSGMTVALKRLLHGADSEATARMRREIEAQQSIKSRHVMPVLESAPDSTWYTMPVADAVLWDAPLPISDSELVEILQSCIAVLKTANRDGTGHLHRDITPRNIMRITWENDTRWVLADWGLVRRHRGQTTELRTRQNAAFGTEGFAGPEQSQDAHEADHRSEIYALGRVAAWALTGTRPLPNLPLLPSGRWRSLVAKATDVDVQWRFQSWAEFADALARVMQGPPETPLGRARAALPGAQAGNVSAAQLILRLAAENPRWGTPVRCASRGPQGVHRRHGGLQPRRPDCRH